MPYIQVDNLFTQSRYTLVQVYEFKVRHPSAQRQLYWQLSYRNLEFTIYKATVFVHIRLQDYEAVLDLSPNLFTG